MKYGEDILSIVIPVYNVVSPLKELLTQIENTDLCGIEYIFVDDGSDDGSESLLNTAVPRIDNAIVIHQQNQGLSMARNNGLSVAKCEYVWFVDSDDLINFSALANVLNILKSNRPDFLQFDYYDFTDSDDTDSLFTNFVQPKLKYESMTGNDLFCILANEQIPNYACIHIVRKAIYTDNQITFPIGMTFEDIATTYRLILKSKDVVYVNQILYFYRYRNDSITNAFNSKSFIDVFKVLEQILKDKNLILRTETSSLFIDSVFVTALRRSFEVKESQLVKQKRHECELLYQDEKFRHHGKRAIRTFIRQVLIKIGIFDYLMQIRVNS